MSRNPAIARPAPAFDLNDLLQLPKVRPSGRIPSGRAMRALEDLDRLGLDLRDLDLNRAFNLKRSPTRVVFVNAFAL
jgi:hypothetical protein